MILIRINNTYKTTYLYARFSSLNAFASTVQYSYTNNATQIQYQHIAQSVFKQIINKDFINLFTIKHKDIYNNIGIMFHPQSTSHLYIAQTNIYSA